jgi:hypothetical protein
VTGAVCATHEVVDCRMCRPGLVIPPRRQPLTARNDDAGNRLYTWTGTGRVEEFYSVTTMIGRGVPKHLQQWYGKVVAELAYDDVLAHGAGTLDYWHDRGVEYIAAQRALGMKLKGVDESPRGLSLRYLKGQPDRLRDAAAERGSTVHAESEDFVLARVREGVRLFIELGDVPKVSDEIAPYLNALIRWVNDYRPEILATEVTVYNRADSYAGTADLFARVKIDGAWRTLCIDYKSGRAVYPETAMQCAAYARGEFAGGADLVTEHPLPEFDGTAVLHLTPNGYAFRLLRYDDVVWRSFLYARENFRWLTEIARTALGDPLTPDLEDALEGSLEQQTKGAI